MQIIY